MEVCAFLNIYHVEAAFALSALVSDYLFASDPVGSFDLALVEGKKNDGKDAIKM